VVATDLTDAETEELAGLPEPVVVDGELLELEETAEQERSKYGVVLRGLPGAMPKLGLV
jgi:hypothetical protein